MKTSASWFKLSPALALCAACNCMTVTVLSFGQSPTVFLTASYPSPSRLVRFDSGVESFAVTVGTNAAFLGTTVLNGNVLVADYNGERIQRFSPIGTLLSPFAFFSNPTFLESDSAGNVYTTHFSIGPAVATRFDSTGAVTRTFTVGGPNQLSGVDADAAGNVYVANQTAGAIVKFASDGTLLNSTAAGSNLDDLAIDEAGKRLFVAREFGGGIGMYDILGAAPVFIGNMAAPAGANILGLHFATESGNIFATDFGPGSHDPRGLEFSSGGVLLREYRPAGAQLALDITTFPIPEPTAFALVLVAVVGHGLTVRRTSRGSTTH